MGAHGTELFDDDVAMDVQAIFEEALENGMSVGAATEQVLDEYEEYLEDTDDGPIVWLALAALQLERDALQPRVRREALAAIESEEDMERWEESGEDLHAERRRVLDELKARLEAAPVE